MVIEEYRGYKICQNTKTKWHKNDISGHEWSTLTPANGFHVMGIGIFSSSKFSTIEKAKEQIDFVIKFQIGR
jgi:hypothetical protein